MGITQPGGAGTVIILDDDANATNHPAAPGPHTWAEIAAAFPADFVSNTSNVPQYKALQSVQLGNSANTTTLTDATDSDVCFANTKTLTGGGTATARFLNLGTKVGSGNRASGINGGTVSFGTGTSVSGTFKLYGCKLKQTSGAFTFGPSVASTSEMINCLIQSTATGVAPFVIGGFGVNILSVYNCDFSHTTANQMVSNVFVDNFERITMGGNSVTDFLRSGSSGVTIKDLALFGSPSSADLRWGSSGAVLWQMVRPQFTGNAPKFGAVGALTFTLANATQELWSWSVKVVDRNGIGIGSIPVTLTDAFGTQLVSTTTDASGEISYGSGLTANCVPVMDHYPVAGVYTQRHRSPFTAAFNFGPSRNPNYMAKEYPFLWTGYSTVTLSSGSFEDVSDVVVLDDFSSPTVQIEHETVRRISAEVPIIL